MAKFFLINCYDWKEGDPAPDANTPTHAIYINPDHVLAIGLAPVGCGLVLGNGQEHMADLPAVDMAELLQG